MIILELIYIWDATKETGYPLSSAYTITCNFDESKKNRIEIEKNSSYIPQFWGDNIFDTMAIVGENGSGKTLLLNRIIDIFAYLEGLSPYKELGDLFVIFIDKEKKFICYGTNIYESISHNLPDSKWNFINISNPSFEKLEKYRIVYSTNALSLYDYSYKKYGKIYDASIGALIRHDFKLNNKMDYTIGQSEVYNYFFTEDEKILSFRYSDDYKKILEKCTENTFPDLQYIDIGIVNYIENQNKLFDKLDKSNKKNSKLENSNLRNITKTIITKYENRWITHLILNIIINFIRSLCFEQTSGENKENECIHVSNILKDYEKISSTKADIFEMALEILQRLNSSPNPKNSYPVTYEHCRDFIIWIKNNKEIFSNVGADSFTYTICFFLDNLEEDFIINFIEHYKNTAFPFLYINYSFNISSGEFAFLSLFTNLWYYTNKNNDGYRNLLLVLDEADMLLHPRWQQQYISKLTQFISYITDKNISVQILVATHSPILLSDFPEENVLYLKNKKVIEKSNKTFGCNIYKMFMDSFFLNENGMIGEFAYNKIEALSRKLLNKNEILTETDRKIIQYIGDDIIQKQLLRLNEKKESRKTQTYRTSDKSSIENTINWLKKQCLQTENIIRQLEKLKDDKDSDN